MSCKPAYFSGWGECAALMEKMNGAAISDKGVTWTDATAVSLSTWHTVIADKVEANRTVLTLPIMSFENTTADIGITDTQLGKGFVDSNPYSRGVIALDASLCDYKNLHSLENT